MEKGFYILDLIFSSLLLVNAIQGTLNFVLILLLFCNKCAGYNTIMTSKDEYCAEKKSPWGKILAGKNEKLLLLVDIHFYTPLT